MSVGVLSGQTGTFTTSVPSVACISSTERVANEDELAARAD